VTKEFINTKLVLLPEEALIEEVVKAMVDNKISSVLIHNAQKKIVGIITERDIVRKVTLLEVGDKLKHTASTIMSRGILHITPKNIREAIAKLHMEHKVRHFPVFKQEPLIVDNLIGIVSATDFLRLLIEEKYSKEEKPKEIKLPIPLGIYCVKASFWDSYLKLFTDIGFTPVIIKDLDEFLAQNFKKPKPLLFDIDLIEPKTLAKLMASVRMYKGQVVIATSHVEHLGLYRRTIDSQRQKIALKPLDLAYCCWILSHGYS
jgi:CBS domain-containing protein